MIYRSYVYPMTIFKYILFLYIFKYRFFDAILCSIYLISRHTEITGVDCENYLGKSLLHSMINLTLGRFLSFVSEVCFIGSELTTLFIAYDLYAQVEDPFLDPDTFSVKFVFLSQNPSFQTKYCANLSKHPIGPSLHLWRVPWKTRYRSLLDIHRSIRICFQLVRLSVLMSFFLQQECPRLLSPHLHHLYPHLDPLSHVFDKIRKITSLL